MLINAPNYTPLNLLTNFLFVHGFYPPAHNYIVPGGWSIGTEMAFYACFPLLFILFDRISKTGLVKFALAFIALIITCYALEYGYTVWAASPVKKNNFMYYNLLNQLPVFLLGLFAYFLARDHKADNLPLPIYFISFFMFAALTYFLWTTELPVANSFMFVPFTVGAAFASLYFIFANLPFLNFGILQNIGQVSYSIYIFHFIFAWEVTEYIHSHLTFIGRPLVLFALYYPLTVLLAYLVARLSEKYIEKPAINIGKNLTQRT